jgi:post-segregation antitoxin (ccd killing protein)
MSAAFFGKSYSGSLVTLTRVEVKTKKDSVHDIAQDLAEKTRIHGLNISKITEQALLSIIDCLET